MTQDVPWGKAWWDPEAAGEAAAAFAPTLLGLLDDAYRRAGSPLGVPDPEGKTLQRWYEDFQGTEAGRELARELETQWMFHLQVRFAARQVN